MKLFNLRGRRQAGYCTISEPVSDLSPEVISAIKAHAPDVSNNSYDLSPFQYKAESDEITEPVTLTPTQSQSSTPIPPSRACGMPIIRNTMNEVFEKNDIRSTKLFRTPPRLSGSPQHLGTPPSSKDGHNVCRRNFKALMKDSAPIPEISQGKDQTDYRLPSISAKSFDLGTEAPTERMNLFIIEGISQTEKKIASNKEEVCQRYNNVDETAELDQSFDPEIISVHSDITEPTYGSSDTPCQKRWKRLHEGKLKLTELLGSDEKSQSIFDFLLDLLCQHPSHGKKRRRS